MSGVRIMLKSNGSAESETARVRPAVPRTRRLPAWRGASEETRSWCAARPAAAARGKAPGPRDNARLRRGGAASLAGLLPRGRILHRRGLRTRWLPARPFLRPVEPAVLDVFAPPNGG